MFDCWGVAARECQQLWLQVTEAGAELSSSLCSISHLRKQTEHRFLTCAVADMVILRFEGFYYFISFIMFLFSSSLVVSQSRQEEWLPRGACSGAGGCTGCVAHGRALHTKVQRVAASVQTPHSEQRWLPISMGVMGEEQTTGVLCRFHLVHCGNCIWIEPFDSCVTWEKVSALMKH